MPQELPCLRCGEGVYEESDFCPHCGILRERAGSVPCTIHPEARSSDVCVICHRPLCRRCKRQSQGRSFCADHRKVEVVQDWAAVFQSHDPTQAELVRSVLKEAGFTVQGQSSDSGGVWGGAFVSPSKVFVPIPEYFRARETIREWMSFSPEDEQ